MTKTEIIEACAGFMGWKMASVIVGRQPPVVFWVTALNKEVIKCADYDPTADTQRGREQANELLDKLLEGPYQIVHTEDSVGCTFTIYSFDGEPQRQLACCHDKYRNAALAEAVAMLQIEKER